MDNKIYVSEKPIYNYTFIQGKTPDEFKKNTPCKIILKKFTSFNTKTFKRNINPGEENKLIDAIFISKDDKYIGNGHYAGKYTVKITKSNGSTEEMIFDESEYYFLLTDAPPKQTQNNQNGGKRKSLKQKNHKKNTLKKQLKRNNRKRYSNKLY
jgi:hypothetical protein